MNTLKTARRKLLGPGTVAMIVGLAAFGIYGFFTQPKQAERIYFEADEAGHLRQVDQPSQSMPKSLALWKPEPDVLLARGQQLRLSPEQINKISRFAESWASDKAALEGRMQEEMQQMKLRDGERATVAGMHSQLGGYSELSREYGRRRDQAWTSALAVLSEEQRKTWAAIRAQEETR